jgi:hypothetical protein
MHTDTMFMKACKAEFQYNSPVEVTFGFDDISKKRETLQYVPVT